MTTLGLPETCTQEARTPKNKTVHWNVKPRDGGANRNRNRQDIAGTTGRAGRTAKISSKILKNQSSPITINGPRLQNRPDDPYKGLDASRRNDMLMNRFSAGNDPKSPLGRP